MDTQVTFQYIGVVHSPFQDRAGTPRQSVGSFDAKAWIEIFDDYIPGLKDAEQFSHLILISHLHKACSSKLSVEPPWTDSPKGVFATCSYERPNSIGLSVVRLISITGRRIHFQGVDLIDGTPLLDIKPYIPELFPRDDIRLGWMTGNVERMIGTRSGDK